MPLQGRQRKHARLFQTLCIYLLFIQVKLKGKGHVIARLLKSVYRFADKDSHQIFLEPEGLDDPPIYQMGFQPACLVMYKIVC